MADLRRHLLCLERRVHGFELHQDFSLGIEKLCNRLFGLRLHFLLALCFELSQHRAFQCIPDHYVLGASWVKYGLTVNRVECLRQALVIRGPHLLLVCFWLDVGVH